VAAPVHCCAPKFERFRHVRRGCRRGDGPDRRRLSPGRTIWVLACDPLPYLQKGGDFAGMTEKVEQKGFGASLAAAAVDRLFVPRRDGGLMPRRRFLVFLLICLLLHFSLLAFLLWSDWLAAKNAPPPVEEIPVEVITEPPPAPPPPPPPEPPTPDPRHRRRSRRNQPSTPPRRRARPIRNSSPIRPRNRKRRRARISRQRKSPPGTTSRKASKTPGMTRARPSRQRRRLRKRPTTSQTPKSSNARRKRRNSRISQTHRKPKRPRKARPCRSPIKSRR